MTLEEKVDLLEFQMELLFNNTEVDRFIYESKLTREQYRSVMDLMDIMRNKINAGDEVHHYDFESAIYELVPQKDGDYHFCELIAQLFAEEHRWEEVFPALYGDMPKYGGTVE